jgi:uncharacterized pyridoxal phosphate-containing UPF0001 family protein
MLQLKEVLTNKYGIGKDEFELSMGMSGDFVTAVLDRVFRLNMVLRVLE